MYDVEFAPGALKGLAKLRKSEPACFKKAEKLVEELKEHPTSGTGHPEQLKGLARPTWSRRISDKHRLVYEIAESVVRVYVLSAYGHYDDK